MTEAARSDGGDGGDGDGGDAGDGRRGVGRRTFVKGAMIGAAGGAVAAGGLVGAGWLMGTQDPDGPEQVRYHGAKVQIGSPTDLGVPLVPIVVDGGGFVHGRGEDVRPFLYCQRASGWPGAAPEYGGGEMLRYAIPPSRLQQVTDEAERRRRWWYHDRLGEPIHVDHFEDVPYGEGALFTWRDPGESEFNTFYGVLLKLRREEIQAEDAAGEALRRSMNQTHDLVAFDAACTHFCCIAGWHEDETAKRLNAWDMIFCTCHHARFDPREIAEYSFTLRGEDRPPDS